MLRTTTTLRTATAGLAGLAALAFSAPAVAGSVSRSAGELVRYPDQAPVADAPVGASARVQRVETGDGRTIVTLHASGLEPLAQYGAHAHVNPCGDPHLDPKGLAAGGHFQHVVPTAGQPATHPDVANPANEIWLDLNTDEAGEGVAKAVVDWQFDPARRARSVIIHERSTDRGPTTWGTAGKRVACLDVPF